MIDKDIREVAKSIYLKGDQPTEEDKLQADAFERGGQFVREQLWKAIKGKIDKVDMRQYITNWGYEFDTERVLELIKYTIFH